MNTLEKQFETGDFVSHVGFPKTLGILCEAVADYKGSAVWSVWWLKHPDIDHFGQSSFVTETYIRHFKPWPGFYSPT